MTVQTLELPVEIVNVSDLKADPTNPNRMTDAQRKGLNKSLKTLKNFKLLVVDQNNVIIDGHQRWEELKHLGIQKTQVIRYNVTSEAQRIKIRQLANKLYGKHDLKLDAVDYYKIYKANELDDLADMLATETKDMVQFIKDYGAEGVMFADVDVGVQEKEKDIVEEPDEYAVTLKFANREDYEMALGTLKLASGEGAEKGLMTVCREWREIVRKIGSTKSNTKANAEATATTTTTTGTA